MILAWTVDELSLGQAHDWRTHRHTHTHAGNDNTRRPKLASGNKNSKAATSSSCLPLLIIDNSFCFETSILKILWWFWFHYSKRIWKASDIFLELLIYFVLQLTAFRYFPEPERHLWAMGLLPDTQNCGFCMRLECRECFPRYRFERKSPACITARASRTCRDACWDSYPAVAGKMFPAFPMHAQPTVSRI